MVKMILLTLNGDLNLWKLIYWAKTLDKTTAHLNGSTSNHIRSNDCFK